MFEGYRQPSIDGVPFHSQKRSRKGGRRVDIGEVPFGEDYTTRDMGARAKSFRLNGYVFGPDWLTTSARLEQAFNKPGPVRLVHPTLGEFDVHINEYSFDDNEDEGLDFLSFRFDCVLARNTEFPIATTDHRSAISTAAGAVPAIATDSFVSDWQDPDGGGIADAIELDSVSIIQDLTNTLDDLSRAPSLPVELETMLQETQALSSSATSLIRTPTTLASSVLSPIALLRQTLLRPFDALLSLADFGWNLFQSDADLSIGPIAGLAGSALTKNRQALGNFTVSIALGEASIAALDQDFVSFDDAIAARTRLISAIDTAETTARINRRRDEAIALEDLRVASWTGLGDLAIDLPRLVDTEAPVPMSARALSWAIRGDIDGADDLVRRNNIRHPGHVPAGQLVKLLGSEVAING